DDGLEGGWMLSINRMDPVPVDGYPTANGATGPQFFHTAGPNRNQQTPPNTAGRGDDIPRQSNAFLNFESPNGYEINAAQRSAIEGWFGEFEDVLYGEDFRDPESGYRRYLDVGSFIDYFILHDITRNTDGLLISMWVYKEDGPLGKLKMGPVWDYDLAYKSSPTGNLGINRDRLWYARLWQDPDFEQRYRDRWQALRAGPISDESIRGLIDRQAAEITAPVAEAHGIGDWPSRLTRWKGWLIDRAAAIDKQFEARPAFGQESGPIEAGAEVTLQAGTIFSPRDRYFTTDGSDPRLPGGMLSPSARLWESPFVVEETLRLRARVLNGEIWSGPVEAWYFVDEVPAVAGKLLISKIHYHPADPDEGEMAAGFDHDDDFEVIELQNLSGEVLHLGGSRFVDGVEFDFNQLAVPTLLPNQRLLLVRNEKAFAKRYGDQLPIGGPYEGRLRNGGERLALVDFAGELIDSVTYGDEEPWPISVDGNGPGLVRMNSSESNAFAWRPDLKGNGSPGAADTLSVGENSDLVEVAFGNRHPSIDPGLEEWVLRHPRVLAVEGLGFRYEWSEDLIHWRELTDFRQVDRVYLDDRTAEEWLAFPRSERRGFVRMRVGVRSNG
ncbi:MAG: CotH kinase family protein, partial [Verrucomicrobiota bacterium]